MSTWKVDEKESKIISALGKEADRSVAIIGATLVEDRLTKKIKANLRDSDGKESETALKEMFRSSGPLGDFATKIRLGFLLRLYGTTAYRDLVTLKNIRNLFAHRMEILSFQTNEIVTLCKNLMIVESYVLPMTAVGTRPFQNPTPVGGIVDEDDWNSSMLQNGSVSGTIFVDDVDAILSDYRVRYLTSCGLFMSHLSFPGWRTPLFIGDEPIPSLGK